MTQSQQMMQTPHQRLVTRLFLSPQVTQELSILQFSVSQLDEYLKSVALSNPLIQLQSPRYTSTITDVDRSTSTVEVLSDHLLRQNRLLNISSVKKMAVTILIMNLNQAGYLQDSLSEISCQTQVSEAELTMALPILQSFDPVGVGAQDLCECLLLQAQHKKDFDSTALKILKTRKLELLAQSSNWHELPYTTQQLQRALSAIQSLNPLPGNQFAEASNIAYLIPDLYLEQTDNGPTLRTASDVLPTIIFDDEYYQQLLSVADRETKKYLREQVGQYEFLQSSLIHREQTLLLIGEYLVTQQLAYFQHLDLGMLKPMTLRNCAIALGYADSTISRAVQDKYLQVGGRVIPLRSLFQRNVNRIDSQIQILQLISKLIKNENIKQPLSDGQISQLLKRSGHSVARRTVTKYRVKAGFPTYYLRRRT